MYKNDLMDEENLVKKKDSVKVEVLVGTLQIEWPIGKVPIEKTSIFGRGDTLRMPLERAITLGTSVKILRE